MCEIFCFNSNKPEKINDYLSEFYNHSDEHPHGWGLAVCKDNDFIMGKEPIKAKDSEKLSNILSKPIVSKTIFAHIRLATMGRVMHLNCHPFVKVDDNNRSWLLIHNGTIFSYPPLDEYKIVEKGDTDSERILLYIVDRVNEFEKNKNELSTAEERFKLISEILTDLAKGNKLNIMIFDGEVTYIHSNFRDSMYYLVNDRGFFAASSPVSDEDWELLELNKVFALCDGKILLESPQHDYEFILTKEKEDYLINFIESLDDG